MDEQKTQTSAQPESVPLLLIARELWRKLGLILMFAATAAACGYIAATLLYRPAYQTQTTFVVSVRNGSTVYANLNTASTMAETLSTFFEGDVMRKCITNDIGAVSGTIKAKQIPETNLLTMTVSAPTQRDAYRITQSVLRNYNEQASKLLGDVALDVLRCPAVNLHEIFTGLYLTENDLDKLRRGKDAVVGFEKKFKISRQFLDSLAENDIMQYDFSAFADSMLIMHGTRDETVPIDAVRRFAEKNDLMLIEINGADHMFKDPARMSEYVNNTVDFIFG